MRNVISITHVTLDGVVQSNGGPEAQDEKNGFKYGGWQMAYQDKQLGEFFSDAIGCEFDLLLGRKTYELFAGYWPQQTFDGFPKAFNNATKYVASHSPQELTWEKSEQLKGDAIEGVRSLKRTDGPELQIWGSATLIQTLLKADLIDQMTFITYPLVLGPGDRLFGDDAMPTAFKLVETTASDSGAVISTYKRAGSVPTGSRSA